MISFDLTIIKTVVFDVDGTLYDKNAVRDPEIGSVQTSHDFFRFTAYQRLLKGCPIEELESLSHEYRDHIAQCTLSMIVENISEEVKQRYLRSEQKNRSNGKIFVNDFGADSSFLHSMLSEIDFKSILSEDKDLQNTINYLSTKYNLGILTTEVYDTVVKVTDALGLNITDFYMNTEDEYKILCSENVRDKKPSPEGFERLREIYLPRDSKEILYVGDHIVKDIIAPLGCGLQAVRITQENSNLREIKINSEVFQYRSIPKVSSLRDML